MASNINANRVSFFFGLALVSLFACERDTNTEEFRRVTGSNAQLGELISSCRHFESVDGAAFQIYALPERGWSPQTGLAGDHPAPGRYEKGWARQTWKRGLLKRDEPIVAAVAAESAKYSTEGDCDGKVDRPHALEAIRSAVDDEDAYYAFSHAGINSSGSIPAMSLYLVDEKQSIFVSMTDDR